MSVAARSSNGPSPVRAQAKAAAAGIPALVVAAGILLQGFVLVREERQLPGGPFHGCPNCLSHFWLKPGAKWNVMEQMYPDDMAWVHVIGVNFSEWLVLLHDENTPDLNDLSIFRMYLDDILIYSKTKEHVKLVRAVLKKLRKAQLYMKLSKCDFHKTSLDYLQYWILKRWHRDGS